jgi:trehalose-phosphatase
LNGVPAHWALGWAGIGRRLASEPRLLVACDFDGTLAPIVVRPEDAQMPASTAHLLRRIAMCDGVELAFVSGRRLSDLRERVGIDGAIYCGNHGREIEGPSLSWCSGQSLRHAAELEAAVTLIKAQTAAMPGVLVEDKGLTATVHWRLASEDDRAALPPLLEGVLAIFPGLELSPGKAIWEILPAGSASKGAALHRLLRHLQLPHAAAIFVGDDTTDESAFQALEGAVTVHVGDAENTAARYRARNVRDVASFLFCLLVERMAARPLPAIPIHHEDPSPP